MKKKQKIYIILNIDENTHKIGYSKDIEERIKGLEVANSSELKCIHEYPTKYNASMLETFLHRHFKSKHIRGEWFKLNDNDIKSFDSVCEGFEKRIDFLKQLNNPFV